MEYRVLARKYRPQTFADLIGQEVLVRTLTNAFATGRVAHAFLLTGIRGIGKTTTARIIARALNCVGADGNGPMTITPCGVCSNCTMIAESRHMDVLEMDAASHTGVDDIRDLIGTVQYLPSSARFKVYIIDEVHMLSNNAFNALLKTLEEPPPHVKFIFATTEIRKIPVTILSRCQRFDLKRTPVEMLATHLGNVAAKESVKADGEALTLIANAAEGSVRDGLSLLDQAIAHSDTEAGIRTEEVRDMLGMGDKSQLFALLRALMGGEVEQMLKEYHTLHGNGADPSMLLQDLLALAHFITRVKLAKEAANDITYSEHERKFAEEMAGKLSIMTLSRLWQMLLKGLQETRIAPNPSASAEMTLIRIAHAADLPPPTDLIRTIRSQQGSSTSAGNSPAAPAPRNAPVSLITTQQTVARPAPVAGPQPQTVSMPETFAEAVAMFEARREGLLHQYLMRQTRLVRFEAGRIEINASEVPVDFAGRVGKCLSDWTGQRWLVALSREQGEDTLYAQKEVASKLACEQAASHPLVKAVMEHFPGSTVTKIISKED